MRVESHNKIRTLVSKTIHNDKSITKPPITFMKADNNPTREAARVKATKRMAYADCFAVALARLKKAEIYTGDREFKAVEKDIKVVWL